MSSDSKATDGSFYAEIPKGVKVNMQVPKGWERETNVTKAKAVVEVRPYEATTNKVFCSNEIRIDPYVKGLDAGPYVMWLASGNRKVACLADVVKTEKPAPRKAPVSSGPTLRQRLVPGTKWKLTNPAAVEKLEDLERLPNGYVKKHAVHDFDIPVGSTLEVIGKQTTYNTTLQYVKTGLYVPVMWLEQGKKLIVSVSDLKDPEQVGEAEVVPMFVIWDNDQQAYYTGYEWLGHHEVSGSENVTYDEKLTKAKKFKRLSDARAHLLTVSGYYDGLPGAEDLPEWVGGPKMFDVPNTWELVQFDKLTKKEIKRYELLQTFKRTWKLRELTMTYGSNVRAVYSDLEKKGKLGEFSAVLILKKQQDTSRHWDWELTPDEEEQIKGITAQFDKKEVKLIRNKRGAAIACKDVSTAMMVRLSYDDVLDVALIDWDTMAAVVKK